MSDIPKINENELSAYLTSEFSIRPTLTAEQSRAVYDEAYLVLRNFTTTPALAPGTSPVECVGVEKLASGVKQLDFRINRDLIATTAEPSSLINAYSTLRELTEKIGIPDDKFSLLVLKPGDQLAQRRDDVIGQEVYLDLSGEAAVYEGAITRHQKLETLRPGERFGVMPMSDDVPEYTIRNSQVDKRHGSNVILMTID